MSEAKFDDSMPDYRNALEIQFFGLQRSGNHAVLAWLFQQFPEPVYFFNNAKHFGNPLKEFQSHDLPNTVKIRRGEARLRQLEEIGPTKKRVLAYSYENLPLRALRERELVPGKDAVTGLSSCLRRVLIIRDFDNWFASRIRYHEAAKGAFPSIPQIVRFAKLWAIYAREYAGETQYLRDAPLVRVCFNRWVRDDSYRCEVLDAMAIKLRDNSISYVPSAGGGSSFDATRFSGRAEQMPIFDRWRFLVDGRCAEVLPHISGQRPVVERLNKEIFGVESSVLR